MRLHSNVKERSGSLLLERALLFTFAMHGLGMLSMVSCLLPGMPGGGREDVPKLFKYIASHPWIGGGGWLRGQLTAFSVLLLALAFEKKKWIPRVPAILTLL